jgi:hypothetical protein
MKNYIVMAAALLGACGEGQNIGTVGPTAGKNQRMLWGTVHGWDRCPSRERVDRPAVAVFAGSDERQGPVATAFVLDWSDYHLDAVPLAPGEEICMGTLNLDNHFKRLGHCQKLGPERMAAYHWQNSSDGGSWKKDLYEPGGSPTKLLHGAGGLHVRGFMRTSCEAKACAPSAARVGVALLPGHGNRPPMGTSVKPIDSMMSLESDGYYMLRPGGDGYGMFSVCVGNPLSPDSKEFVRRGSCADITLDRAAGDATLARSLDPDERLDWTSDEGGGTWRRRPHKPLTEEEVGIREGSLVVDPPGALYPVKSPCSIVTPLAAQ